MKTAELNGPALDWAVAKCEVGEEFIGEIDDPHFYSTDWSQGGPIIEREGITIMPLDDGSGWLGEIGELWSPAEDGLVSPTPLIAAMRCYVESKLGDYVELPEELR